MACSKYQYVKKFQETNSVLLQTYIVIRIDGKGFSKFCADHNFNKPVDIRAINLMNQAALFVMNTFRQILVGYGQSDEYSFVLDKYTTLFSRRSDKILSTIVSAFSSAYVFNWGKFFDFPIKRIPIFDSRAVVYPNQKSLKDYFRWRQVDCHINNLYNTTFWLMVKAGKSHVEVENILKDTNSGQKNQILFSQFNINYNQLPQIQRKGTIICYKLNKKELNSNQISKQQMINQQKNEKLVQQQKDLEKKTEKGQIKEQKGIFGQKEESEKKTMKQKKEKIFSAITLVSEDLIKEQFWETIKF